MKNFLAIFIAVILLSVSQPVNAQSSFTIREGWNLVSADVISKFDQSGGSLEELINSGGAIFALNRIDKKYYGGSGNVSVIGESLVKMNQMTSEGDDGVYALGWWLYSPKQLVLTVDFSVSSDFVAGYQESYHFNQGWNLVGITSPMLKQSLSNLKGTCRFASVYNFEAGEWRKQTDADLQEKFTADSLGHALAVKVENDCVFDFKSASTRSNIPALPN